MFLTRMLLLGLLAGNVLLRFFTNWLGVLPRSLNIWDLIVTLILAGLALAAPRSPRLAPDTPRLLVRLLLFDAVCVVGSVLNPTYVHPLAALSQLLMWNEPILLFVAVTTLPFSLQDIAKFRRLLLFLVCLEVVIGVGQVPSFLKTGESERIIGTFAGNAEQFQWFVLLGLFYLSAEIQLRHQGKGVRFAAVLLILVLVVLIDNKASWIALALTLALFIPRLPARGNRFVTVKKYAFLAILLFTGWQAIQMTSATYTRKFGRIAEAARTGNLMNLGKVKAVRDVANAYANHWQMPFVGSGLGTFYSRAAFQFFPFHIFELYDAVPASGEFVNDSASMAGILDPIAGMKPFYKVFYDYERIFTTGSGTADFPTSSYISLLGETGVIGTCLYLSFYVFAVRAAAGCIRRTARDAQFFSFAATTYASLVYLLFMGAYNFWLDCGRVNTIAWCMLALSIRYTAIRAATAQADSKSDKAAVQVPTRLAGAR